MAERRPKIFIVGISGFLGYRLAMRLRDKYLVSGAAFSNYFTARDLQVFPVALKSIDALDALIRTQAPDFTINACAITDQSFIQENEKAAEAINTMLAVSVAVLTYKLKSKHILLSCSEVYEGKRENYAESDMEFTLSNTYGKQKVAAESYVRTQTMESTILRIGRVLGPGSPYRLNFFDRLRNSLASGEPATLSPSLVHSYLSAESFCSAVEAIMAGDMPSRHRIFNLGGCALSEHAFAAKWMNLVGASEKLLRKPASGPHLNLSMDLSSFQKAYPAWKPETEQELMLNLLKELTPGVGVKKWQKTLQIR